MVQDRTAQVLEIARSILRETDLDVLLRRIVHVVVDSFGFEACTIFLWDERLGAYAPKVTTGYPENLLPEIMAVRRTDAQLDRNLSEAERWSAVTHFIRAMPDESLEGYFGLMHPERVRLPRPTPESWHELDVLYVLLVDSKGRRMGYLEPEAPRSGKIPTLEDAQDLEVFASLAGIAIETAQLVSSLHQSRQTAQQLVETTAAIQEPLELGPMLAVISEKLKAVVPWDEIAFYLVEWEAQRMYTAYYSGPYYQEIAEDPDTSISGLAGSVARSGEVEIVEDLETDSRIREIESLPELHQAAMSIPLKGRTAVVGVVTLYRNPPHRFASEEAEVALAFANHAALAIENAKLRDTLRQKIGELERAFSGLKMLDQAKDNLIDIASHEIRTPLTAIMGYLDMAQHGMFGEVSPKFQAKLISMAGAADRINRLVWDMVEVSKLERGVLEIHRETLNVGRLLVEVAAEIEPMATAKGHRLSVEIPPSLPSIHADRLRIREIVENLITNAVKYTNPGGTITLNARPQEGGVLFSVQDTGVGISEQDKPRIFDKFFITTTGLARADNRVGLGLYISQQLVKAHGGRIWFESAQGKGSTFYVFLPTGAA